MNDDVWWWLRRWLRTRRELGDPPLYLKAGGRRRAVAAAADARVTGGRTERGATASAAPAARPPRRPPDPEPTGITGPRRGEPVLHLDPGAADPEVEDLAREGTAEQILALPDMGRLRAVALRCTRCRLAGERARVVFAEGPADARVLCVGEAPGAREDETGRPFVGRAGKLLDQLLLAVGFPRERVFICNVLKCRPPGNRNPQADEIEACSPFLLRQVELVDPSVIVAFGTFAARTLLDARDSLGRLRQRTHRYRDRPLVVTYHPAALLRNPQWTRPTWEDLQKARAIVDRGDAGESAGAAGGADAVPELRLEL